MTCLANLYPIINSATETDPLIYLYMNSRHLLGNNGLVAVDGGVDLTLSFPRYVHSAHYTVGWDDFETITITC